MKYGENMSCILLVHNLDTINLLDLFIINKNTHRIFQRGEKQEIGFEGELEIKGDRKDCTLTFSVETVSGCNISINIGPEDHNLPTQTPMQSGSHLPAKGNSTHIQSSDIHFVKSYTSQKFTIDPRMKATIRYK